MLSIKHSNRKRWKNWSHTVVSYPECLYYPKTVDDIFKIIEKSKSEGKTIRVVGAGHSFTPLVATSEYLVSLDHLSGIHSIDYHNNLVTVWSGTNLRDLGILLYEQGYAMENLGDIDVQSIAGAISTGTHGTGIKFGSISTQVNMITIVTASGDIMDVSPTKNSEYLKALQLSLGMLGIMIKVQLRVIPIHRLQSESQRLSLTDCLKNLDDLKDTNRHFEFFWFPYTKTVQVKTMNPLANKNLPDKKASMLNAIIIENGAFRLLSELARIQPRMSKMISHISARGIPVGTEIGYSHSIYATPRLVRFSETEYSVPAEHMASVVKDIKYVLDKKRFSVHFPIECRYVLADDIWLSPSYERDSAYIAVHMYKGMPFQPFFDAIEEVFKHYEGRPHWGKMHSLSQNALEELYPRFNDFLKIREKLDPTQLFLNGYLKQLFGL